MDKKQKQIDALTDEISREISEKVNYKVNFSMGQPDKETLFFEPTVTLQEDKPTNPERKIYRSRIYLTSQENVIYHFPTATHKILVEKAAKVLAIMTGNEITVKEAPCKTCPNFLKCRMSFPCAVHFQQIGSNTETSCVLRNGKDTFEKEFVDDVFNPIV